MALALRGARARLRSSALNKSGNDQGRRKDRIRRGGTRPSRRVRVQVSLNKTYRKTKKENETRARKGKENTDEKGTEAPSTSITGDVKMPNEGSGCDRITNHTRGEMEDMHIYTHTHIHMCKHIHNTYKTLCETYTG